MKLIKLTNKFQKIKINKLKLKNNRIERQKKYFYKNTNKKIYYNNNKYKD